MQRIFPFFRHIIINVISPNIFILTVMMRFLLCLFLWLCAYSHLHAQISLNATPIHATCSANGELIVQVTGGVPPYSYLLNGALQTTISSNAFTYTGLQPNTYQIQVIDNVGASVTKNEDIMGSYIEPSLTFAIVNCNLQAIVSNGLAPFLYAMSDNDSLFTNFQPNATFSNLIQDTTSYIRVIDACGNIATTVVAASTLMAMPSPICTQESDTTFKVNVGNIVGGQAPYNIVCIDTNGVHNAVNGVFLHLKGCTYTLQITDACNRISSYRYPSCIGVELPLNCIDCDRGNLSFEVIGGMSPSTLKVVADVTGFNTSVTNITNLPNPENGYYYVSYADGCPNKSASAYYYCLNTKITCISDPFDGRVSFDLSDNYKNHNPLYPMTVICLDCANHDTVVIGSNNDLPIIFEGMMTGAQHFEIIDACGTHFLRNSDCFIDWNIFMTPDNDSTGGTGGGSGGGTGGGSGGGTGGSGSGTGQAICGTIMNVTIPLAGCTYNVFTLIPTPQLYATNTIGIFPNTPPNKYLVEIISPLGFLIIRDTFDSRYYFQDLKVGCHGFTIGVCPGPAVFTLIDGDGTVIYANDTTGIFENLIPGNNYIITATQLVPPFKTITKNIEIPTIGKLTYDIIGCSELHCHLAYQNSFYSPQAPTFTLQSDTGTYFMQNSTGDFVGLNYGIYTLTVTRGDCDTIVKQLTMGQDLAISPCSQLYYYDNQHTYWETNTYILADNISDYIIKNDAGQVFDVSQAFFTLPSGNYVLISPNCELYSFSLPSFPKHHVNAEITSVCSNLACIKAKGAWHTAKWENWAQSEGFSICGTQDYYVLVYGSQRDTNTTGVFCNLKVGGNYKLYLLTNYWLIDSMTIAVPYYEQPNLTATLGALCTGDDLGEIMLMGQGSGAPFTYQILNPPMGYSPTSISTSSDSVTFFNLPVGNYQFMVFDDCGYSSDFTTAIGGTAFVPQYQRFCNGDLCLKAPLFTNATYVWTDANGNEIGYTNEITLTGSPFGTYQVFVTFPLCNSVGVLNVPPFTGTSLVADAGIDQTYPFYAPSATISLQGNVAPIGVSAQWHQISPSSSNATITHINQANTTINVTNSGVYTFVWYWETSTCIATDTVTITFSNCASAQFPLTITTDAAAETCKDRTQNGSAWVNITGGLGPFTIEWSNGATNNIIKNLSQGTYYVTVTDKSGCFGSQDSIRTVLVPFMGEQPKAYFESTPSEAEEIVQNMPVHFQNFSQNASQYSWHFQSANDISDYFQENVTHSFLNALEYTVTLSAYNDYCEDSYTRYYKIVPPGTLYIPNAFTPHNGDAHNNTFVPIGTGIVEMHFWVYSRWGILIFESDSADKAWDGTFKGEKCPEGVYTYRVSAKLMNGNEVNRGGTVTLIR